MATHKAELIIHPVRLRILQAVAATALTTQEISEALPDVPTSSVYRHLKLLLEGGIVDVVDTHRAKGTQKKVYRLIGAPHLSQADITDLSKAGNLKYFTAYIATLLQGFSDYLNSQKDAPLDLEADYVGYTEIIYFANEDELKTLGEEMSAALQKVARNPASDGRQLRKMAFISHPVGFDKEKNEYKPRH